MFRRLAKVAVAAAALSLVLTGCADNSNSGSGPTSSSSSGSGSTAGGDAVAWAERVCKSVEPDFAKLSATPDIDTSDPAKAKSSLVAYLGNVSSALDHIISSIKDAGPPPVSDGQQTVDKATTALQSAKTSIEQAKANLEKASATDPAALEQAFTKFGEDMAKLGDPFAELDASKELKEASEKAPTCQKLEGSGDPTTSSTPSSAPTS